MNTHQAVTAAIAADKAWSDAYRAICPRRTWPGDFRYTAAAKGEPGSELRRLYEAFRAASDEMGRAFEVGRT